LSTSVFQLIAGAYIAHNASILRDVTLGEDTSIWFNTVLRGDDAPIVLGDRVNVQDLCMIHPDPGITTVIGDDVTIGHSAIIHCKSIGKGTLIGMGAILMENAEIGEECLIAAGALVPPNCKIPNRSLFVGMPGKVKRELSDEEVQSNYSAAKHYVEKAKSYLES